MGMQTDTDRYRILNMKIENQKDDQICEYFDYDNTM